MTTMAKRGKEVAALQDICENQAATIHRLKARLTELREAVDSILCLAVEGPEACGYLEAVTAITKVAEASLKRPAGVEP